MIRTGAAGAPLQSKRVRPGLHAVALLFGLVIGARAGADEAAVEKLIWVSGETYLVEPPGDSIPDAALESSPDGKNWSRSESVLLEKTRGQRLAATPRGTLGKRHFRLRDAKTGRLKRRLEVTLLPQAGSPETGPYLQLQGEWDGELLREQAGPRVKPPRAQAFMNAAFRLSKARGGESLENSYDRMNRSLLDTLHAYASSKNVLPVAICNAFFHYVHKDPTQAKRGQYARVSLGKDTSETNLVTFMARPDFVLTNNADAIAGIEVSGDGFSLTLPPDGQAEALISGSGLKRIRFNVRYASGKKMPGEALLFVKRALSQDEIKRRNENLARSYDVVRPAINFSEGADR